MPTVEEIKSLVDQIPDPDKSGTYVNLDDAKIAQIEKVVSSRDLAVVAGGALLANAGGFIPIALKSISQTDPSTSQYIIDWFFFSIVSLLPLAVSLVLLVLAPDFAERVLGGARNWLERNGKNVAAVIILARAITPLFNGISGLT